MAPTGLFKLYFGVKYHCLLLLLLLGSHLYASYVSPMRVTRTHATKTSPVILIE